MEVAAAYLEEVIRAARGVDLNKVNRAVEVLQNAYNEDRSVYVIGNGGSAANGSHFAEDLSMGAMPNLKHKRFRVLSLTDNVPFITALSNDIGYEHVFDLQLRQFARKGDILIAISGSGNSENVINAVKYARRMKMTVIGLTGFDGGKLKKLSHVKLHVPIMDMCKSEAVHSVLQHMVTDLLRDRLIASEKQNKRRRRG